MGAVDTAIATRLVTQLRSATTGGLAEADAIEALEAFSRLEMTIDCLRASGAGCAVSDVKKLKGAPAAVRTAAAALIDKWKLGVSGKREDRVAAASTACPLASASPAAASVGQKRSATEALGSDHDIASSVFTSARHVCIKVPGNKDKRRRAYEQCADREAWVQFILGADGQYCGRPKNDGGWYKSPTVKAGSMFANPFALGEHTLEESIRRFRELCEARASNGATTERLIAMLPPTARRLAENRFLVAGEERPNVGKSVAHLELGVVGRRFRCALGALSGRRLGCFCDEADPCHAKVLAELADRFASEAEPKDKADGGDGNAGAP